MAQATILNTLLQQLEAAPKSKAGFVNYKRSARMRLQGMCQPMASLSTSTKRMH